VEHCAIFVDAGYVYAEGGRICVGSTSRTKFTLDARAFTTFLQQQALSVVKCPTLRIYWYDGAKDGIRTAEQLKIAELPQVKLRLGRLNSQRQQKGVDALIYRDMITLAQNRAVRQMVLLSGDEDLHEGVTAVQDLGVRLTLMGIEPEVGQFNQSKELVLDADEHLVLSRSDIAPMFRPVVSGVLAPTLPLPQTTATPDQIKKAATAFAENWTTNATPTEIAELIAGKPRVPRPLDRELLADVERQTGGSLRGDDAAHRNARSAFWQTVSEKQAVAISEV